MDVQKLTMDKDHAKSLHEQYQQHRSGMTKDDRAIAALYKRIAQGKLIIRALASITAAGLKPDGLPQLAICRADMDGVRALMMHNRVRFDALKRTHSRWGVNWATGRSKEREFDVPIIGASSNTANRIADVPLIPVHLRPRRAIDKYFVLWEAEWFSYPVDPYLLRRCGEDAWIVCASWDLTPVERAVMSSRLNG